MNINSQIKEMTTKEKLMAMELLWDELCHESKDVESPAWQGEILSERSKIMESGKAEYISLEEMKRINDSSRSN